MPLDYTKPSRHLMTELLEVAAMAESLIAFLETKSNVPLTDFPSDQLVQICTSLSYLPHGSAEGCREPLIYARKRLPSIRREHIMPTSKEEISFLSDNVPQVSRGDALDQRIKDLLGSVSTALDQYQTESNSELEDDIFHEISVNTSSIVTKSYALEKSDARSN